MAQFSLAFPIYGNTKNEFVFRFGPKKPNFFFYFLLARNYLWLDLNLKSASLFPWKIIFHFHSLAQIRRDKFNEVGFLFCLLRLNNGVGGGWKVVGVGRCFVVCYLSACAELWLIRIISLFHSTWTFNQNPNKPGEKEFFFWNGICGFSVWVWVWSTTHQYLMDYVVVGE